MTRLLLGPCASVGVHVNRPLFALMEAPVGAPASRLNVNFWTGIQSTQLTYFVCATQKDF